MHPFSAEILRRFPEVWKKSFEGDEDLPYLMGAHLVDWLAATAKENLNAELVDRVVEFHHWCRMQPQGQSAEEDIPTIEMVSFLETLFKYDQLIPVITRLLTRRELQQSREYWVQWVGQDRYQIAMRSFNDD